MVDLQGQYRRIQADVDAAIREVLEAAEFIQGPQVRQFEQELSASLGGVHTVTCGNGTDALQVAMMALGLGPGDEVILPVHTYVATAEVIALLKLTPVFADVDSKTFTLDTATLEAHATPRTRAIVPVHLYGQCADMDPILAFANKRGLHVIEDAAQSLGARYRFPDGREAFAGCMGVVGTTSFFPSKNLGAYGDGGAMFTNDHQLAGSLKMIANHGQRQKYQHDEIGVNSRLDTLQAAILRVKLRHLNDYEARRRAVADYYDAHLSHVPFLETPYRAPYSTHVFHQYTVRTRDINRDDLKEYLQKKGIPSMIYYPIPLHLQAAYRMNGIEKGSFPVTELLSDTVLSLPIHTEMDEEQLSYICKTVASYV